MKNQLDAENFLTCIKLLVIGAIALALIVSVFDYLKSFPCPRVEAPEGSTVSEICLPMFAQVTVINK